MAGIWLSVFLVWPSAIAAQSTENTFKGQAMSLRADLAGKTILIADAGPLPPEGGEKENWTVKAWMSLDQYTGFEMQVPHALAKGGGDLSQAEASLANLKLVVGGAYTVTADFVMAQVEARCPGSFTANSDIAGLVVNGQPIPIDTTQPNQVVPLVGGKIVINEQMYEDGKLTVNGLHVIVEGAADVIVASAQAGITCPAQPEPPLCEDYVTGSGWIDGTPSGAKGQFGVAGGIKKGGKLWGHLIYSDSGPNGVQVKGTAVTSYVFLNSPPHRGHCGNQRPARHLSSRRSRRWRICGRYVRHCLVQRFCRIGEFAPRQHQVASGLSVGGQLKFSTRAAPKVDSNLEFDEILDDFVVDLDSLLFGPNTKQVSRSTGPEGPERITTVLEQPGT